MLYTCRYCGRLHKLGEACPQKPARKQVHNSKRALRSTARWTRTSLAVRERDGFLCRACLQRGILRYERVGVHHIQPLEESDEHAFDFDWLITLCDDCHEAAERGKISREELRQLAATAIGATPPTVADSAHLVAQDHKRR